MGVYGEKGLSCPRVEYSYTYQSPPGGRDGHQEESLEIKLRCPRVSSFRWCLKLYSLVLAALGLLLSFIWICFQLYVLSQTTIYELRLQRYLDIFLGLLLLLSLVCLLYGSYCESHLDHRLHHRLAGRRADLLVLVPLHQVLGHGVPGVRADCRRSWWSALRALHPCPPPGSPALQVLGARAHPAAAQHWQPEEQQLYQTETASEVRRRVLMRPILRQVWHARCQ